MTQAKISKLFIYPLKSARGIELDEMPIVSTGPQYDREWMLVNEKGSFISQRTHPKMSQLKTQLTADNLIVSSPDGKSINIPKQQGHNPAVEIQIFGKSTQAIPVGAPFDQWFSQFLGQKVRLVRSPENPSRYTSGNNGPVNEILFPDGYPLLLTNAATLTELNEALECSVSMQRFRPNIVISGVKANIEDQWKSFKIDDVIFLSVKACTRCVIIDIDPETGTRSKEVSQTLKTYRTKDGAIIFGANLTHQNQGIIKIGSELSLLS